jgi:NAD(P)H-dependent FMN reductase
MQIDERLNGAIRVSRLFLLARPGAVHRTHFSGMRALGAALMRGRTTAGPGQRLLTAKRCRNEDLHDHVAQHHCQAQRREVPSDGSHRLAEIILQASASMADLPQGLTAMTLRIPVIYGSVRSGRQGIKVARFVERQLRGRGHEVALVDPLQEQLPLLERRFKDYQPGTAPATLERLAELYRQADAFVIVSGEYNHGVPPALTNLLDYFLEEYSFRPSGIVSYSSGAYAGVRAAVQLREMLCTLGMPSIPATLPVPNVQAAANDDGSANDPALERRFGRFAAELEWYAEALKAQRTKGVPSVPS